MKTVFTNNSAINKTTVFPKNIAKDFPSRTGGLKIKAIENIDEYILRPVMKELERRGEHFRLLLLPDHPTPIALRTHVREPIPFVIYDSEDHPQSGVPSYFDHSGDNGVFVADGDKLIDMLIRK